MVIKGGNISSSFNYPFQTEVPLNIVSTILLNGDCIFLFSNQSAEYVGYLYFSILNANGSIITFDEFVVVYDNTYTYLMYSINSFTDNTFLIVWSTSGKDYVEKTFARYYNADGTQINTNSTSNNVNCSVYIDNSNSNISNSTNYNSNASDFSSQTQAESGKKYIVINYSLFKAIVALGSVIDFIMLILNLYLIYRKCFRGQKHHTTVITQKSNS